MHLRSSLLLVLALLTIPATARAAAPWSAPAPITGSTDASANLVFAPDGTGLVGWSVGGFAPEERYETYGATIGADGTAGAARKIGDGMLVSHLAPYGAKHVVAAGGTFGTRPRTLMAFGNIDGTLGKPFGLTPGRRGYVAGLAVNPGGDIATLVRLCPARGKGCSRPTPHLVVARANDQITPPIRLGKRGPVHAAAVATNARGDVLAVWERPLKGTGGRRGVYTRVRTAGGRLGRTKRIGTSEPVQRLSAALGDDRTALVGWMGQDMGEGMPHSPAEVWLAVNGAAQRVQTVPELGTGRYVGQAGVKVAIAADGRRLAAWTGYANGRFVVKAAEVSPGAPVQVVSDPAVDTVFSDLATGSRGEAVVVGLSGVRGADPAGSPFAVGVIAAVRPPAAATFGGLETVAERKDFRETADAEFVPGTGRAVVVWRDLETRSVVTATRDPIP